MCYMKQAATEKKTTLTKPKTRQKLSASVAKNAKMPEKSVSAKKIVSAKSIKPPAKKTEKTAAKTKVQNAKTVRTANGKILTAKPKAAKVKTIAAEKSISRTGKKIAAKSVSAVTPKKSKTVAPASVSKIKKTIEKFPVKTAKTKVGVAKKTLETVKPKTATKPKTIAPKIKNVPKKSAAKAVSKVVTREVKIKTARNSAKPKISAQPERKDILKYAKPAITGKVKSPQRKAASIKIEVAKIEPKILEEIKVPKKKPLRAISSAIFRGEKDRYQFKVYEIGESFKEISAVYVISKRITDRRNRGHHKLICIGQTNSILKDLKTHRKSKCLRVNKANVISILREENEEIRLKIENDLKAAHSIACNLEPGANLK